ncbi:MAG: hypothetical protein JWR21_2868 [Herminiimonas sp.]|nr:hypothetical protein [Herminiimonas sp.]
MNPEPERDSLDEEMELELDNLLPARRRNQDDIGTLEFYDRQDRLAHDLPNKAR